MSEAALSAWAKSKSDDERHVEVVAWLPLYQHLDDTAAVAGRLWNEWVPNALKHVVGRAIDGDDSAARALFAWLAAIHDVGKVSPAFAVQVPKLARDMVRSGFDLDHTLAGSDERRTARHEIVSHIAARDWLVDRFSTKKHVANPYASVLAAHHGLATSDTHLKATQSKPWLVGDGLWESVRREYLDRAWRLHGTPALAKHLRFTEIPLHCQVILSGLVIVADWIASNDELFPLSPLDEHPGTSTASRLEAAWSRLDLPGPWVPEPPPRAANELFAARFALPAGARVRPVQRDVAAAAWEMESPSLLIVEAEMGAGKTEAALAAAEILAARFKLGGVFIGLPTQATSDGMFARIMKWTQQLGFDRPQSIYLAHGKNALNQEFARLSREGRHFHFLSGEQDSAGTGKRSNSSDLISAESAVAHHWFSSPKRGPLSSFVIGTIDQALFAGLRSRHLMLRHLSLAGKVVVIDEVHAYSAYMGRYLDRVLHWLAAYEVPVVMLSATLPTARRAELVAAYQSGKKAAGGYSRRRNSDPERDMTSSGYPAVTLSLGADGTRTTVSEPSGESRVVVIDRLDDSLDILGHALRDALRDGGCAAVIRNTVGRAQDTAKHLAAEFADSDTEILLAHSRFLALDRAAKDARLLNLFGPPGRANRPRRFVVVATQVIEQSLDIDFDLMVSDLAPVDLLLQRAGRLHRHRRGPGESNRPVPARTARLILTGVDWAQTPPEPVRGSMAVYSPYVLYRTLAAIGEVTKLSLPDDIPRLVQAVYGEEQLGPAEWQDVIANAHDTHERVEDKKRNDAGAFLLGPVPKPGNDASMIGWVHAHADDPASEQRGRASVRDGEDTVEVLVLQRDENGVLRTPTWLANNKDLEVPQDAPPPQWLAETILGCAIRLPARMSRPWLIDGLITELENSPHRPAAWNSSYALRRELLVVLDQDGNARLSHHALHYNPETGLEAIPDDNDSRAHYEFQSPR
ncbi:CRISPR-associated helicase Cas3' [Luethyella okanaganae]|uniref:CRISPR-associated helicase Cas3 n=1 Tax=Luethyella okanaganae TaxID=69372 RepID=A0ABW1VDB3_9MICO